MFGIKFAVVAHHHTGESGTMTSSQMDTHLGFLRNQCRLAVNRRRSGFDSTFKTIEFDDILIRQITVFLGGDVG